ncbi:TonB-dependent receptor [Spirosoma sp. SC4-14]|uniref:TonB-dependent receptor domain-containing protein n=1 Tax=Spirosoma sp. SC4-14 TaxID=3128900 RepID=UPI0030CC403B
MKKFLLLLLALTSRLSVLAQINVEGIVTDANQQPLAGVTIVVRGTSESAVTQTDGHFMLPTAQALPFVLLASLDGYQRQNIQVRGNNFRRVLATLVADAIVPDDRIVAASRVQEPRRMAAVTTEKLGVDQFRQSPAISPFDAIQNLRGVDFFTQSFFFKSVNMRGFGATDNFRFLQLTDGMDNRSPGLGFGFGNVAGLPDLDVETIELVPGASSALYGPGAMQGLLSTTSKNPFTYQGLSAQLKAGANNFGKPGFGPKGYGNIAIRYAKEINDRLAIKINFQHISATDFIADNYDDRSTRARDNFFATNSRQSNIATGIAYRPNSNASANLQYDGVNVYGDEINAGGAYLFPSDYANVSLQNKLVTRTGYSELAMLGNSGSVFNNRANVSIHYKLADKVEASLGWYYGNGNFIQTGNYRNYFPDYRQNQFKAEIRGENFFLRAYTTQQKAEGWSIGQTAVGVNNAWKSLDQWATEFGQVYIDNKVSAGLARNEADRGSYLPGTSAFNRARDRLSTTFNTDTIAGFENTTGTRFRDNSSLWHYEGMYNFTNLIGFADVIAGASVRHYALNSAGTLFALKADGSEYSINEYGAYVQATKALEVGSSVIVKPTVTLRYDKNQYVDGRFSPRAAAVVSAGNHAFRVSWQTAFRNPSPMQLFAAPAPGKNGEDGGDASAIESAGLLTHPAYPATSVASFMDKLITEDRLRSQAYIPAPMTTEKMQTWEVGYNVLLTNKLTFDAYFFHSAYTDLITAQPFFQTNTAQISDLTSGAYRTLQINFNSFSKVFVNGAGVSLNYEPGRGYLLSGNYAYQVGTITLRDAQGKLSKDNAGNDIVRRRMSNPEVIQKGRNYFNSPENRFTISLSNAHLTDRIGATLLYRWTGRTWYEQGITAGDVWLPSWGSLDAQVSYRLPHYKSIVKLGGTNLLNQYYAQGYGLARIGGLYYVSVLFDELL